MILFSTVRNNEEVFRSLICFLIGCEHGSFYILPFPRKKNIDKENENVLLVKMILKVNGIKTLKR